MLAWTKISFQGEYVGSNPTQLANFNNKTKYAYSDSKIKRTIQKRIH